MVDCWDSNGEYVEAFVPVNTGKKHPDPQYSQYSEIEYHWNGKLVVYIYEGKLETLSGFALSTNEADLAGLNALRDQLRNYFPFNPSKGCFEEND